jgi:hypothetical protein
MGYPPPGAIVTAFHGKEVYGVQYRWQSINFTPVLVIENEKKRG